MPNRSMTEDDPLEDFDRRTITIDAVAKSVYVAGTGPAVIVMPEMPGISPHVARFARWVRDAGFTVFVPSLFGRDGAVPTVDEGLTVFKRACVSAEFRALAADEPSPAVRWLRSLAASAHEECGGPGVGVIGMCFTGNFALSMMLEPSVIAPVLAQPSLPLDRPDETDSGPEELEAVRSRLEPKTSRCLHTAFEVTRSAAHNDSPPIRRPWASASSGRYYPTKRPTRQRRRSSNTSLPIHTAW